MENFSPIFFCFWRDGIWPVILSPIRWIVPHWTSEISAQPVGVNSSDPDLEIRRGQEGGAGHLKPEIREGRSPKNFFGPSGLSLVIKMRGGGLGGGGFPSPGSASRCKKGTLEARLRQTQTWICTTWPSFPLPLLLLTSTKKIDLTVNWSHRNVFLLLNTKDRSQISVATTATRTEGGWPVVWLIA